MCHVLDSIGNQLGEEELTTRYDGCETSDCIEAYVPAVELLLNQDDGPELAGYPCSDSVLWLTRALTAGRLRWGYCEL